MPLRFRNIDATPADPVESWGFEGMLAAIDRGYQTRLTQAEAASRLGTSRPRMTSYLSGAVTPSMDVLVAVEALARERRTPSLVAHLELV